jgi:cephalosporin hydroxylase
MNLDVLTERYELLKEKNSDIGHYMDDLVNACVQTDAHTVIELGVRYGASTIAFLYGLYGEDDAALWSVDCSFPVTDPETGLELLSSQGSLGCVDYWVFLLGYDTNALILESLPDTCDLLFIDTNHVYEETLLELELYRQRVSPGGLILLHDTFIETTGNDPKPEPTLWPVRRAVEEFCTKHSYSYEFIDTYPGLGTVYV